VRTTPTFSNDFLRVLQSNVAQALISKLSISDRRASLFDITDLPRFPHSLAGQRALAEDFQFCIASACWQKQMAAAM
jgi:hypothetical protein